MSADLKTITGSTFEDLEKSFKDAVGQDYDMISKQLTIPSTFDEITLNSNDETGFDAEEWFAEQKSKFALSGSMDKERVACTFYLNKMGVMNSLMKIYTKLPLPGSTSIYLTKSPAANEWSIRRLDYYCKMFIYTDCADILSKNKMEAFKDTVQESYLEKNIFPLAQFYGFPAQNFKKHAEFLISLTVGPSMPLLARTETLRPVALAIATYQCVHKVALKLKNPKGGIMSDEEILGPYTRDAVKASEKQWGSAKVIAEKYLKHMSPGAKGRAARVNQYKTQFNTLFSALGKPRKDKEAGSEKASTSEIVYD